MIDQTFPEWIGCPLDEIIERCRDLVEDPSYPTVKRWREAGGKVVGHFQVYFPEEIVHAAGMLPLKIKGAPLEPVQAESRFGSYLCSILKTSLELALTGQVELDMFVTHPICDAARNLAGVWGRNLDSSICPRTPTPLTPVYTCAASMTGCGARSRKSPVVMSRRMT